VREPTMGDIGEVIATSAVYLDLDGYRDIASLRPRKGWPAMGAVAVRKHRAVAAVDFETQDFDLAGYLRMAEQRILDEDPIDVATLESTAEGTPVDFVDLSEAMMTDLGFGFHDLVSVIQAGLHLNLTQNAQSLMVDAHHYRQHTLGHVSAHAHEAFDFLVFSADHLNLDDLRPTGTRYQRRRIVTHPFIIHSGIAHLNRDLQFEALNRWWMYLVHGDWPVPPNGRGAWPNLAAALTRRRKSRGTEAFEPLVEAELDRLGLPWGSTSRSNVTIAGARITGEVDAMVVDASKQTLWVLECKDLTSDQNLRSLQSELERMLNKHGKQVERTTREVAADPQGVARHLVATWSQRRGLARPAAQQALADVAAVEDWTIKAAMVVRDRSAAEFLIDKPWDVTPVSGLAPLLRS
jgi:hypothetical protein